jgi:hypothetical protein
MRSVTLMNLRAATPRDVPQLLSLVRRYWDFERIEGFEALRVEMLLQRLLGEPRLGAAALAGQGCVRLQLQLGVDNAAARAFYEHRGYAARAGYRLFEKTLAGTSAAAASRSAD